ncbi:MAG: AMP-binding protein, partial [Selenomonadaceae bacterium]|nr:AMP-binding protein [Selenomonadaceae bacterium]
SLPFTTPAILSEHGRHMLLLSQSEVLRIISGETSGTSGEPKRIFYTRRDLLHTVELFTAGIGEMAGAGNRVLIDMPFSGPHGLGELIEEAVKRTGADPIRGLCGHSWKERMIQVLREQPDCIIAFPVPLLGLARFYEHCHGRRSFPIHRALISGDACPSGVTECLVEEFSMSLFPHYGSREMALGGAIACPAHEGMHLRENHLLAEIVDNEGQPLPDGQEGELVITTLDMEAMPLIRYRTGDRTRFLPGPCPCGGVTKRLDRVSRMDRDSQEMEELDSLLFRHDNLIDCRATWEDGRILVELRTWDGRFRQELPSSRLHLALSPCRPEDFPFYAGKRKILYKE